MRTRCLLLKKINSQVFNSLHVYGFSLIVQNYWMWTALVKAVQKARIVNFGKVFFSPDVALNIFPHLAPNIFLVIIKMSTVCLSFRRQAKIRATPTHTPTGSVIWITSNHQSQSIFPPTIIRTRNPLLWQNQPTWKPNSPIAINAFAFAVAFRTKWGITPHKINVE